MIPFSENLLHLGEKTARHPKVTVVIVSAGDLGDEAERLLVLKVVASFIGIEDTAIKFTSKWLLGEDMSPIVIWTNIGSIRI